MILFANPFTLIDRHLPGFQAYFLGDSSAGWLSINGGTLYLRNAYAPTGVIRTELARTGGAVARAKRAACAAAPSARCAKQCWLRAS